jgi:hypothetical protein
VKNADDLALLYNDRSPMEHHHLAASFLLLQTEEFNCMVRVCMGFPESLVSS